MATNVSSLRVAIRGDVSGLEASLVKGQKSVTSFQRHFVQSQVSMQSASSFFGRGRSTQVIQNLGFAAEDAAVSFGTQGLAGALRGSANNLALVAGAINPIAGAVVGVSVAVASAAIPAFQNWMKEGEKTIATAKRIEKTWDRLSAASAQLRFLEGSKDRIGPAFQSSAEFRERLEGSTERQKRINAEMDITEGRMRQILESRLNPGALDDLIRAVGHTDPASGRSALLEFEQKQAAIGGQPLFADDDPRRQRLLSLESEFQERALELRQTTEEWWSQLVSVEKSRQREATADFLRPLGRAAEGLVGGIWQDMQTAAGQRDQFKAIAKERNTNRTSQGLAGGFEFGSREAVSTLNRAMFRAIGEKKEEKEIAKNTHGTEIAVRDVVRAVRDLGNQFLPALAGEPL